MERSLGMPVAGGPTVGHDAGDEGYDTVMVVRVTVDERRDQFLAVAVSHTGDDPRQTKKLIAEEIANAALH